MEYLLNQEEASRFKRRAQLLSELKEKVFIHQNELDAFAANFLNEKNLDGSWQWNGNDKLIKQEEPKLTIVN